MGIYEKLLKIQTELKAPKGQYNSFGGYNYRSCEDILENVKPLLEKNKLSMQLYDELENIGDRYYVKATVVLLDIEDNSTMTNTAYAREDEAKKGMDGSQITGTASSYARKYALNGLLLIDDTKDADTDEYTKQNKRSNKPKLATPIQVGTIKKVYKGDNLEKLLKTNNIEKIEDLPFDKAEAIITKLAEKKKEMEGEQHG